MEQTAGRVAGGGQDQSNPEGMLGQAGGNGLADAKGIPNLLAGVGRGRGIRTGGTGHTGGPRTRNEDKRDGAGRTGGTACGPG